MPITEHPNGHLKFPSQHVMGKEGVIGSWDRAMLSANSDAFQCQEQAERGAAGTHAHTHAAV